MDIRAIVVTGAAYLILLILLWKTGKGKIRNKEKRKRIRRGIWFFFLVNTISVAVFIWTGQERPVKDGKIGRNQKGGGSRNETILATVEGVGEDIPIQIQVDEQGYTKAEAEKILAKEVKKLEKRILEENTDLEHVTADLDLMTSLPDYPVSIQWTLDNYQYMIMY